MDEETERRIWQETLELQRLGKKVRAREEGIYERFENVISIFAANSLRIYVEVTHPSEELKEYLDQEFSGEKIDIVTTKVSPCCWSLLRVFNLRANEIGDVSRHGHYMAVEEDSEGAYLDVRFNRDTPESRQKLEELLPDFRIRFSPNDRPLKIRIEP